MRLMKYDIQAKHVPGKDMLVPDALSRSPMNTEAMSTTASYVELYVQIIETSLPASDAKKIRQAARKDSILQSAVVYTLTGWPKFERDVLESLKDLYAHRASLSVSDGLLLFGSRIIVPASMRPKILKRVHDGHRGITKPLERARLGVWWPGITKDINRFVSLCSHCTEQKPKQHHEPLMPTPLPQGPWQRVGVDLFYYKGKNYLVMCDHCSRWIEVLIV